jgi:predicted Zn-dependent protease
MIPLAFAMLVLVLSGCSALQNKLVWRARDVALTPAPTIGLQGRNQQILVTVRTPTIQRLLLAHLRITRSAGIQAELVIVEGDEPNAFAGLMNGQRVVGINIAMLKLIGDDMELFAALLGHETAHWAKGHVDAGSLRSTTIQGIGTAIGVGLGAAGVPAAGLITGLAADMIEATYSRDDEREADAASVDYMAANGFDPAGAVRLQEKFLKLPGGLRIPFLSSHPSSEERIENLQKIIEAKKSYPNPKQQDSKSP